MCYVGVLTARGLHYVVYYCNDDGSAVIVVMMVCVVFNQSIDFPPLHLECAEFALHTSTIVTPHSLPLPPLHHVILPPPYPMNPPRPYMEVARP